MGTVWDACPACENRVLESRGSLPELRPEIFGGTSVGVRLDAGNLVHCPVCGLFFRAPYVTQAALTDLYANLPPTVWESKEPRPVWPLILELMLRYSVNRSVMDVGCYSGDFLAWLPPVWRKIGVEPNH